MNSRIMYEACPLCGSTAFGLYRTANCANHPLYHPSIDKTMRWMRCEHFACEHVFTDGYFTEESLATIFRNTNEKQQTGYDYEAQRFIAARIIEKVRPLYSVGGGSWLDIGFGNGALVMTAHEFGYNAVGVDLRKKNVEQIRKLGIEAHACRFEELPDFMYSVISMCDVLEHMPRPKEALLEANRLLKPFGSLIISLPNMDSICWRMLDAQNANPYWAEIEHYHNFGQVRLYNLLKECGLSVERYGVSERYRAGMEVYARKNPAQGESNA